MKEKVEALLTKALEEKPSLFLISLTVTDNNHITVVIDGDEGVAVQDCIEISRAIEHNLDREEEDFSLEVFSAGASEPLQLTRQYKKHVGRDLEVKTEDTTYQGTLVVCDDEAITLQWKTREPKPVGKGKHTVQKEAVVTYKNIVQAKVMIKFN